MAQYTPAGTSVGAAVPSVREQGRMRAWHAPLASLIANLEAEQDRWFLWLPVLYGLGVAAYFALLREPPLLVALGPLAVAFALKVSLRGGTPVVLLTGAAIAASLGFAVAKLRTDRVAAPILERRIGPVEVRGFVERIEPRAKGGERLTIEVTSIGGLEPAATPRRVRLSVASALPGLGAGEAVRLKAVLVPPGLPALPGGYDFAREAFFSGIGGVGYAVGLPQRDRSAALPSLRLEIEAAITRVRQAISRRITAALPGERGAVADALITGERGGISEATNDAFRDSGIFHILSISGLHMTIMAGAVFFAIRFMLAAVPAIALTFPVKKAAAVAAVLAALGYLLISGGSFATVRAWIMISIMFLAVLLDRPAVTQRNVALGALLIMALIPESLFDVGFQMSFAAVLALVATYEAMQARWEGQADERSAWRARGMVVFFGGIVLSTLVASAAVAPFAVYHFHKSQQYAVLANLIAIPVCNVVVLPAALATLVLMPFGLEAGPLWVMGQGIDVMVWCAGTVARIPGAVAHVPAIPTISFALMIGGGLWLCLWQTRWRLLGLAGLAAGIGLAPMMTHPDILAGRDGDLVAVRTKSGTLSVLSRSSAAYELQRWLEHDGDDRSPREAVNGAAFRCDGLGCTAMVKGVLVAVARHPGAVTDDCSRAGVLILGFPQPRTCRSAGTVIDYFDFWGKGTHALYLGEKRVRVVTVADWRGSRPWVRSGTQAYGRQPPQTSMFHSARAAQSAAPGERNGRGGRGRPDGPAEETDEPDRFEASERQ